ncbi:hypothetical protein DSQ53_04855 [Salmonella enterica]|nr:hypothetical protein [Salmonella enterica]
MKKQQTGYLKFYSRDRNLWGWSVIDHTGYIWHHSARFFRSRQACVRDAEIQGFGCRQDDEIIWHFSLTEKGKWKWYCADHRGYITRKADRFFSGRRDCTADATHHGYAP